MADDFSYEIIEKLGIISTSKAGWSTELNKISWGGRPAKFDIRPWAPEHEKMGKGLSLTKEELISLKNLLNSLNLDSDN